MKKSEKLDIGHLHNMHKYRKGYYVYIGSAMNSLVPRLNRHLSDEKKMHWHIDYLLKSPDCGEEIPGFGCSDCSCSSHLIYFKRKRDALASTRNAYEKIDKDYHNLSYLKKKHKIK